MKLSIEIDDLTEAQAIAIEDMMAAWVHFGSLGRSRWTKFFADGDGNFQPKILVNGEKPKYTNLISRESRYPEGEHGDYQIDFDSIAWRLRKLREKRDA